jgi:ectoine hydroxylase-related dioxygenase (phytanoyl-CoA dioxygenase family)
MTTTQPTTTALPDLSAPYPISDVQREQFRRDGHVLIKGLASPEEVAAYKTHITRAVDQLAATLRPMEERDTYGKAFIQAMNLWKNDEAVKRFVFARRFAQVAADLMGVDGIRLYHDQALYKEPGGGHTPWHQDQYYWPLDTNHTVTMWMPLVDVPIERGALTFASQSHREGFQGHLAISDESDTMYDRLVREKGYAVTNEAMRAGDATFHAGWTLHHAPGNATDTMREVMTIIYFADGARVMQNPDNENRWNDLRSWLPGVNPGEPAASELNPVLFTR